MSNETPKVNVDIKITLPLPADLVSTIRQPPGVLQYREAIATFIAEATPTLTNAVRNPPPIEEPTQPARNEVVQTQNANTQPTIKTIVARNCEGRAFTFETESTLKIQTLMEMIEEKIGLPPCSQRLVCCGKYMEAGRTLGGYGVEDGACGTALAHYC